MSTNDQRTASHVGLPSAESLLAAKQRRRVQHLLYTRKRLADLAAQMRAHGLDEALELYTLQLDVEQVILDEFPAVFDQRVWEWAEEESAAEHHPAASAEACVLCQAVAADRGKDLELPLAA